MTIVGHQLRNLALGVTAVFATVVLAADKPAAPVPAAKAPAAPAPAGREIQFSELGYYFVKNTVKIGTERPGCLILSTQAAFDEHFGVGMVMRADRSKLLQEGDFDKNMVVSILQSGRDIREMHINKIRLEGKTLVVEFSNVVTEANASWTGNFHATARVERCEFSEVRFMENGKDAKDIAVTRP